MASPHHRSDCVLDRVRRSAVLFIFLALASLGLLGGVTDVGRVCTETTANSGVVRACRPLTMTDPPMVFGTLTAALLLGSDAATVARAALELLPAVTDRKRGRR